MALARKIGQAKKYKQSVVFVFKFSGTMDRGEQATEPWGK